MDIDDYLDLRDAIKNTIKTEEEHIILEEYLMMGKNLKTIGKEYNINSATVKIVAQEILYKLKKYLGDDNDA